MNRFKRWIILKLIGGKAFVANIHLIETLAVDVDKSEDGEYINVRVNKGHDQVIPDVGVYLAKNVIYRS